MYINSEESSSYFPENEVYHFKVHLKTPNICKETILNGSQQPLMRRLERNVKNGWSYVLDPVIYLPVKRKEITELEVYIKTTDDTFASLLDSPLHLTLHFKQYPFWGDHESF
ncbi:hypothetical protein BOW52_11065 [Solemya elarraichensis gill symbiont]|uniref:Uncharacterized protein n=1 Tax=Solemya elarraichensis gill symbiont TaxID=1918949 RepID=A0A1T2KSW4_9GAMM|nr:hypothetical protein BOW52_11065 [Solemya elarraichensis gill symbiont]